MSSSNALTMASTRHFDAKTIRTRGRPIAAQQQQPAPLNNNKQAEIVAQSMDSMTVTLSAQQTIQVNLLNKLFGRKVSLPDLTRIQQAETRTALPEQSSNMTITSTDGADDLVLAQEFYSEYEEMNFSASGTITLSNGTETTFSYGISYSRKFTSYSERVVSSKELQDPLVINFSDQPVSLSSDTVEFDLNMDGEMDNMATLSANAGFIAIDKNNNGIIDDGSELFGAQTGNGFAELAQFDDNQDGFINADDEIFSQLLVWQPGAEQELRKFSDTSVDTISLQSMSTEYSFKDANNNTLGQMRQTSIYANKDGSVGAVHQIDLAI